MSNYLKITISFLITLLIAIIIFLLFFLNILNIKSFDFINTLEEQRYTIELNNISSKIDESFYNEETNTIKSFINSINLDKYSQGKKIDISADLANAKNLIFKNPGLKTIKFYDNSSRIIFSTDENEQEIKYQFISFNSKDGIEKKPDFYKFSKNKISFITDSKNFNIIVKNNLVTSGKPVGVLLFYYDINFINDILRKNNFIDLNNSFICDKNIILIDKPDLINTEQLTDFNIDSAKIRSFIFKDKYGNQLEKKYRLFVNNLKHNDITLCRLIDNNIFDFDFKIKSILFFLTFFVLYLLILMIFIAMDKSRFEKLKNKASLFTSSIIEDIIQAKSKNDLEKILNDLDFKKENALNFLLNDSKKLKSKDVDSLKDQINIVFDKINDLLESKLKDSTGSGNLDKVEMLLEKFINTIAEKGININTPLNITQINNTKQLEDQVKEIEVEEIENLDEADIPEMTEETASIKDNKPLEVEEIGNLDDADIPEMVEEAVSIDEKDFGKPLEVEEINEEEIQDIKLADSVTVENLQTNIEETFEVDELETQLDINENKVPINDITETSDDIEELENIEELESEDDIPKIPKDFYNVSNKNDELAKKINEINEKKTPLQNILSEIYKELQATKLSFLINTKDKTSFMQIYQIGNEHLMPEFMSMDESNPLVKHVYDKQRMAFVSDIKKYKTVCDNKGFIKSYSDMKSLFIYPIKFFNKIRSIILIFFKDDMTESLDIIIDNFEKHLSRLKKEISKII